MNENIFAFAVLVIIAGGIAAIVIFLLRKNLMDLLDDVVKLQSCTIFYSRVLSIGVLFIALSSILSTQFDLKNDAAFMEYVWKVASGLSSCFGLICLFLAVYVVVITILVAVLRQRSE
ncbi:MAG: hypothetical protein C0403_12445 [Desulfobacterium sp.]|nr:hypothetical protein [Desulfobacterium sp.]